MIANLRVEINGETGQFPEQTPLATFSGYQRFFSNLEKNLIFFIHINLYIRLKPIGHISPDASQVI